MKYGENIVFFFKLILLVMFGYLYMLCYIQYFIYYTYITLDILCIVKYVCDEGNLKIVNLIMHKSVTDM